MGIASLVEGIRPQLPEGTRIIEHGPIIGTYEVSFITEFSPDLMHPQADAPNVWTRGSATYSDDEDYVRRWLGRLAERHNNEWAFVHSPEYAVALAKTKAAL